ncbi:hypothetical protein [Acinetobacter lactucae]|uniref:hypothetical protein n=1 Tax=Acinetobacter lactucae TaxID=1785128 RepID=UPI000F789484|nr:hypothetical protein [Acinetobacter lactucae]RSO33372.1 hypothetical protein EA763_11980 [Acinetobacter lactucae]
MFGKYVFYTGWLLATLSLSVSACADNSKVKESDKNIHGLELTHLPYNSNDHLKCIMKNEENSCSKVNLVKSSNLIKYYSFISPAYGDSVVLPETDDSKQIIVSPFEANEDEGPQLEISIINAFGVVEQKTISAKKNVVIDKNYNLIYKDGNKEKILKLK